MCFILVYYALLFVFSFCLCLLVVCWLWLSKMIIVLFPFWDVFCTICLSLLLFVFFLLFEIFEGLLVCKGSGALGFVEAL